jgi:hypothetical protein
MNGRADGHSRRVLGLTVSDGAGHWALAALVSAVLALTIHWFEFKGVFAGAEGIIADWYLSLTDTSRGVKIMTIAIDDEDYSRFFNRTSPLDPTALMEFVRSVHLLGPSVVGVDILTDSPEFRVSYEKGAALPRGAPTVWAAPGEVRARTPLGFGQWLWGSHEGLLLAPGNVLGKAAPVVEAKHDAGRHAPGHDADEPRCEGRHIVEPGVSGDATRWGVPVFPRERDRVVRRLPRCWDDERHDKHRTFAGAVADEYCGRPNECAAFETTDDGKRRPKGGDLFVSYGSAVSRTPDYFVRDLFECNPKAPEDRPHLCTSWKRKPTEEGSRIPATIVLIGGTFGASRDFFDTPSGERTSGLVANAHAVNAEIHGPVISELSPFWTLILDFVVGMGIGFVFGPTSHTWLGWLFRRSADTQARWKHESRWRVVTTIALALALALSSYPLLLLFGILWFTWVGMILVGVAWHLVWETRHMSMQH